MTTPIIAQAPETRSSRVSDLVVVGGGAAGLATAIFAAREFKKSLGAAAGHTRIVVLDGARNLGAKILISGGSRCNVTNARVDAADFWRSGSPFVRQVLRAFPVSETIAFFRGIGVVLKEEPLGKLFPETNKARTVLDALIAEARQLGVEIRTSCRVLGVEPRLGEWNLDTSEGPLCARSIVLATGGLSLPKTGSDGAGYAIARGQGHTIVPPVPALEPLILGGDFHEPLSGIAHEAAIRITRLRGKAIHIQGSLLWTHFGISGPLALNASRFMRRAKAEGANAAVTLSFVPGLSPEDVDQRLVAATKERYHHNAATELARAFGLVQAIAHRLATTAMGSDQTLSRLTKVGRRALVRAITALPLDVLDGRGYNYAEVTSGGVTLDEVNPKTMESRLARGLYFVGEILDVDGRIGGFNFQWAWATAKVAGRATARRTAAPEA